MTISAKVVLDSINKEGHRLTTFEVCYPRYIHDEVMAHRAFSRNAASSRAMTVEDTIKDSLDNPVQPIFMKNQNGMMAEEYLEDGETVKAVYVWTKAHEAAILFAKTLSALGVHKQIANRLLFPFINIRTIISVTEIENFFFLRLANDAQQEIQEVAAAMKRALSQSKPKMLFEGAFHIPYITKEEGRIFSLKEALLVSAARCARVSYNKTVEGGGDEQGVKDLKLARRLARSGHWSPFEHQAAATLVEAHRSNFVGWTQHRHIYNEIHGESDE